MEIYEVYHLIKVIDGNLAHIHWGYFSSLDNALFYLGGSPWNVDFVVSAEDVRKDFDSGQILVKVMEGRMPKTGETFMGAYVDAITWFSVVEIRRHELPETVGGMIYRTWSPAWGAVSHIYSDGEFDDMWERDIASIGEADCDPDFIRYSSEHFGQTGDHVIHATDQYGRQVPVVLGIRQIDSTEYPTIRRTEWFEQHEDVANLVLADVLGLQEEEEEE